MSATLGESTILTLPGAQDEAKIDPRSPQDGLKTDLKRDRFLIQFFDGFLVVLGSLLAPFWAILGSQGVVWGSPGRPFGTPRASQKRSK